MTVSQRLVVPSRRCCLQSRTSSSRALAAAFEIPSLSTSSPSSTIPLSSRRAFSATTQSRSRIGRTPLFVPDNVQFTVAPPSAIAPGTDLVRRKPTSTVNIKGPLGELSLQVPWYVQIDDKTNPTAPSLGVMDAKDKTQRAMWGTIRALLNNHILGVSEGHIAILSMVGIGYRATIESASSAPGNSPEYEGQKYVALKVGYAHPVELGVPLGVKASVPQPTRILLEGADKAVLMQFAANIRKWRKPEPYKGKGIFVNGETIKLKNKRMK